MYLGIYIQDRLLCTWPNIWRNADNVSSTGLVLSMVHGSMRTHKCRFLNFCIMDWLTG